MANVDLDAKIAVLLCEMLDDLGVEFRGDFVGLEVDQVQHRIKSWVACYIAARDVGLLDELTTSSPSPSVLPPFFGPVAEA